MSLYTANTGSKRMYAIGEPRSSPVPAEMLDAIALLQASGVGSANRMNNMIYVKRTRERESATKRGDLNGIGGRGGDRPRDKGRIQERKNKRDGDYI